LQRATPQVELEPSETERPLIVRQSFGGDCGFHRDCSGLAFYRNGPITSFGTMSSHLRRRDLLAAGALLYIGAAEAQPAAQRNRGPAVWLDMDQADLDDAFDVVKASPNLPLVTRRWAINSDLVRARLGEPKRFSYGSAPIETLDVYTAQRPNAPINIFIHGGAFNMGSARVYAFPAEMFVRAGAHLVVPDFGRCAV
jgi:acetyl esterase/lipase